MATWPQYEGRGSLELASGSLSMFGAMRTCPPDQCLGSVPLAAALASGSIAGESSCQLVSLPSYELVSLPTESDMVDVAAEVEAEAAASAAASSAPSPFPWPMDRRWDAGQ